MKNRFLMTFWFLIGCLIEIFRHSLAFVFILIFGPFGILSETLFKDTKKIMDLNLGVDEKVEKKETLNPSIEHIQDIELTIGRHLTYDQIKKKILKLKESDRFNLYLNVKVKGNEPIDDIIAYVGYKLGPDYFKSIGCRKVSVGYIKN